MSAGHGLVIGKFYPPHRGHHHLIRNAAAASETLTVLVMAADCESIPLADRVRWLRAEHADDSRITVLGIRCDIPVDLGSGEVWAAQVACMRAALDAAGRASVDTVFSSEPYGDELARRLGAGHHLVDLNRVQHPVSGTAVRADLAGHWRDLAPATRAGLVTRIVVVGAESTGTTTVSRALAEQYQARGGIWSDTAWVPEYGRQLSEQKLTTLRASAARSGSTPPEMADVTWDGPDFADVAGTQNRWEDAAAAASSPLLVCDTDSLATTVWERRYLGEHSTHSRPTAAARSGRRFYLLTDDVGVPFVQDGLRDGEHLRSRMTGWFSRALTDAGESWALLTGPLEARVRLATAITDQLLTHRATFTAPLG